MITRNGLRVFQSFPGPACAAFFLLANVVLDGKRVDTAWAWMGWVGNCSCRSCIQITARIRFTSICHGRVSISSTYNVRGCYLIEYIPPIDQSWSLPLVLFTVVIFPCIPLLLPGLQTVLLRASSLLKLARGRPLLRLQLRLQRGHSSVVPRLPRHRPTWHRQLGKLPNRTSARRLRRRGRLRGRNNTSTLRRFGHPCF